MANKLTFAISTPGAAYSILSGPTGFVPGPSDSSISDANGLVWTPNSYAPGTYQIQWSYQGVTRTESLTVTAANKVYSFDPLAVADAGLSSGSVDGSGTATAPTTASPGGVKTAPAAAGLIPVPANDDSTSYNFSWPQYGYGKYFTPTQAFMYIGNLFIDELQGFQYTLQDNRVPVFGYSSRFMDAVGTGKSLVQGQFTLNFVSEGYLYTVLEEYARRSAEPPADDEVAARNLMRQIALLQADPTIDVYNQVVSLRKQLTDLLARNRKLPNVLASKQQSQSSNVNAAYHLNPFDIVMRLEGGGRAIVRRIEGCVLTANEQVFGSNDDVILDGYSFLARRIT